MLTNLPLIITVHKWYGLKYILRSHSLLFISHLLLTLNICEGQSISDRCFNLYDAAVRVISCHRSSCWGERGFCHMHTSHRFPKIIQRSLITFFWILALINWFPIQIYSPDHFIWWFLLKFNDFHLFPYIDNRWFKSDKLVLSSNDDSLDF